LINGIWICSCSSSICLTILEKDAILINKITNYSFHIPERRHFADNTVRNMLPTQPDLVNQLQELLHLHLGLKEENNEYNLTIHFKQSLYNLTVAWIWITHLLLLLNCWKWWNWCAWWYLNKTNHLSLMCNASSFILNIESEKTYITNFNPYKMCCMIDLIWCSSYNKHFFPIVRRRLSRKFHTRTTIHVDLFDGFSS
ncbi:hypothetical protein T03_4833, partial [Trichinella britovi]